MFAETFRCQYHEYMNFVIDKQARRTCDQITQVIAQRCSEDPDLRAVLECVQESVRSDVELLRHLTVSETGESLADEATHHRADGAYKIAIMHHEFASKVVLALI